MTQHADVLIVGGGVVGLTAALAMAKRQLSVVIIDAKDINADLSKIDARVYAINQASKALLSELGVWQHVIANRIAPYSHMHVWDASNGAFIDFDSRHVAAANLGWISEESVLKHALLTEIKQYQSIQLVTKTKVQSVVSSEESIQLRSDSHDWQGDLLLIADGAHSPTRAQLNVGITNWSYQQQAIVATVHTEKAHQKTAYQVFNPDGPLAFLPLSDPNQCSIVWSTSADKAQQLMDMNEALFNKELGLAFASKLGAVNLLSARQQFPLHMRHVKQYSGQRWLLLGDAAHTIHPLAGLGLNVGLADISSWINCLQRTKGPIHSKKVLGSYHRERTHSVWQIILQMEGFKQLFGTNLTPLRQLRGWGLRACNELTPLKRLFIQQASGVAL